MARTDTNIVIEAFIFLEQKIKYNSSLNLQDLNIHVENIFRDILNQIFSDRVFQNLNSLDGNFTAIDLGDDKEDIAIQITSTTKRKKVITTIEKYNEDYNYKKLVMLYAVQKKPTRTQSLTKDISTNLSVEEWDLTDLNKKIYDCDSKKLQEIHGIITRDLSSNIKPNSYVEDSTGIEEWENISSTDIRNIEDKLLDVNKKINEIRIKKYARDIASGKIELARHSERFISAMKFRIFEVCQEELINFCIAKESSECTYEEIHALIELYTDKAEKIITDKAKDYSYPLKNRDILRKIVLALIDECYLSFDKQGIYE